MQKNLAKLFALVVAVGMAVLTGCAGGGGMK